MMRHFLFVLVALFATSASAEITVTDAITSRALPKFVQELSAEDFEIWAKWQNRQAELRAEHDAFYSYERPYITINKTVVSSAGGQTSRMRMSGTTHRSSTSHTTRGKNTSKRSGSSTTNRNASADRSSRSWDHTTAFTYPHRYRNFAYVPPGPVTTYNPFVKPEACDGEPDWDNLFVPCEEKTKTLTEALDECRGPTSPEKLYRKLLEEWF
jgi:hypothetical protein